MNLTMSFSSAVPPAVRASTTARGRASALHTSTSASMIMERASPFQGNREQQRARKAPRAAGSA